jgi:hypothetical protein
MRFIRLLSLAILLSFGALAGMTSGPAQAAPIAASSLASQAAAPSLTEKARVYCFNRYTGQFLHWGPCGGYRRHYYYRPHYYYRRHFYRRHYYW